MEFLNMLEEYLSNMFWDFKYNFDVENLFLENCPRSARIIKAIELTLFFCFRKYCFSDFWPRLQKEK
jgi:hypothetical protein